MFFDFARSNSNSDKNRKNRNGEGDGVLGVDSSLPLSREPYDCSYWIRKEHQVCLSSVPADVNIIGSGSEEAPLSYVNKDMYRCLGGHCREGAISHFQAWKHHYYTHTTRPPPSKASFLLVSQFGLIPLRFPSILSEAAHHRHILHQHQHMHNDFLLINQ